MFLMGSVVFFILGTLGCYCNFPTDVSVSFISHVEIIIDSDYSSKYYT